MVTLLSKLDARSSDLNSSLVQWLMVGLSAAAIALTTGSAIWHGRTSRLGRAGSRNESRAFFAALLLLSLCLAVMNNLWPGLLLLGLVAVCLAWLLRQGSVPVSPWMSNICVWGLAIAVVTYSFSFRMDYFVRVLAVWSGAALFFQALRPAKQ